MNGGDELPEGWVRVRVGDYFDSWGGATPSTAVGGYWGGSTPWISSKDVKQRRVSSAAETVSERALNETRLRRCPVGSVLVVIRSGVLAHTLPVALTDREVVINQDLKAFDSGNLDLNAWLALALEERADQILQENRKDGTTVQSIRFDQLKDVEIPLPPLAEQRRIVAAVEAVLAKVNAARDRLNRVPAILKRFRQSVLSAACSGRLTADWRKEHGAYGADEVRQAVESHVRESARARRDKLPSLDLTPPSELPDLPGEWAWVPLGLLGSDPQNTVQTGPFGAQLHNDEFVPTGVPVIAVGNLTGMGFTTNGLYHITPEKAQALGRYDVQAGDLLFARSGATLGKVCVAPDYVVNWRMTGHILRARLHRSIILPNLAAFAIWGAEPVRDQVFDSIRGITRPGFNTSLLEGIWLPIPPLAEQQEIVSRVGALFALADRIEVKLGAARQRVDALTRAVLAKAFCGELVPTEADLARRESRPYESAAALLARIRAEREQTAAPTSRKRPTRKKS